VTSFSVLKLITSVDFEDNLNVSDEEWNEEMSFDAFSASELLLDLS